MRPFTRVLWLGMLVAFGGGCSPVSSSAPASPHAKPAEVTIDDALVQFSLVSALAAGDYLGDVPLRQVLDDGDFGIGTFSRLDGEMIVLDGQMYQATADGTVRAAHLDSMTPFAAVTFFNEDGRIDNFAAATLDNLGEQLNQKLPRRNVPYAIRVDGEFAEVTVRSVPAQSPPFQPLMDVVKHQPTWQHRNVRGTLIGLRCPAWIGTLNVSGYHWHFLSDDHKIGGHVLACQFRDASLRFDECTSVVIRLPASREFDAFDSEGIKQQDIDKVERQRAHTDKE